MKKLVLAIDFDGTTVTHAFPREGELMPGAQEYINKLYNDGHYIIIWTCRGELSLLRMIDFLSDAKIPYHKVNENAPIEMIKCKPFPKVFADIYIDDRNLGGFPGWEAAYKMINDETKD